MLKHLYFGILFQMIFCLSGNAQIINTIAGNTAWGYTGDGGETTLAQMQMPWGIVTDAKGNIYFSDEFNMVVRKVDTTGKITTFAGNGSGAGFGGSGGYSGDGRQATAAELFLPRGLAIDRFGCLFIADNGNRVIRKVDTTGIITTIAGGGWVLGDGLPAISVKLMDPNGVAVDKLGNVYIVDEYDACVRKVDTSGIISTFAGNHSDGDIGDNDPATAAEIRDADGVSVDRYGNVYIADTHNNKIKKVDTLGVITTVGGSGTFGYSGDGGQATAAQLSLPYSVSVDNLGNIYIADQFNYRIRKIDTTGIITTIAGNGIQGYSGDGGAAIFAELNQTVDVTTDPFGNILVTDGNNCVRRIDFRNYPPRFALGDTQSFSICENDSFVSLDMQLSGYDPNVGQIEKWSVVTPPTHGVLNVNDTTVSTGLVFNPNGTYYIPNTGYWGNDTFKVQLSDGSASDTEKIYVTITPTSICVENITTKNTLNENINLYPNPVTTKLIIKGYDIHTLDVTNLLGQTLVHSECKADEAILDLSNLPSTMYFVRVNGITVKKILKK